MELDRKLHSSTAYTCVHVQNFSPLIIHDSAVVLKSPPSIPGRNKYFTYAVLKIIVTDENSVKNASFRLTFIHVFLVLPFYLYSLNKLAGPLAYSRWLAVVLLCCWHFLCVLFCFVTCRCQDTQYIMTGYYFQRTDKLYWTGYRSLKVPINYRLVFLATTTTTVAITNITHGTRLASSFLFTAIGMNC